MSLLNRLSRRTSTGRFIPQIDGLRFISIALVFLFHVGIYLAAKSTRPFTVGQREDWFSAVVSQGANGVQIFFAISGFILGLPFAKQYLGGSRPVALRQYFWRRVTRLEPPYIISMLAFFALLVVVNGRSVTELGPHLLAGLVYLHNLIYSAMNPVNGVAWSLEIEVQFYLLAPLLALLFRIPGKYLRRGVLLALCLAAVVLQQLYVEPKSRASFSLLNFIQYFLAGFVLADVFLVDWKEQPRTGWAWDAVTFLGWPALFWVWGRTHVTPYVFPFAILLLFMAAFRGTLSSRLWSNRWLTTIGGMCYTIYLIHFTFISAVGRKTLAFRVTDAFWVNLLVQTAILAPLALVVSAFYFVAFERPFMERDWPQKFRRWLASRKTAEDNA